MAADLEVRDRFLAAADPDRLPPEDCGVRREIVMSWRRSLLSGVDTASTDLPRDSGADALDPAPVTLTVGLIASARAWLVATATERDGDHPVLAELFGVVLDVPPLRDRAADIPALVTEIIAELRPQPPRPLCTQEALAALNGSEWPGNVRQLRQVVATALTRSMSCDITVDDLPSGYPGAARSRRLTGLERAEREALVTALREADWDRQAAARDLGISRATIYCKLKRLQIAAGEHAR